LSENLGPINETMYKRFKVKRAVLMKIQAFWDVTSCRMENSYWRLGRTYCIRLQGQAVELCSTKGHTILEHIPKCA
jgi:hypothetical protein